MKKLLLILIAVFFTGNLQVIFSWDSTAARLYPMAIGNLWSYNYKTFAPPTGCANLSSQYDYIVRIIADTVMPNGKKYFIFDRNGSYTLMRIDSVTMNVYRYVSAGNECLYDSLKATLNSSFRGCNITLHTVVLYSMENFGGMNRLVRHTSLGTAVGRALMQDIGYYSDFICLLSGNRTTLNGCIINGIQYGEILGISSSGTEVPAEFSLEQNYPNPFNPTTNIKFQIPKSGLVKLTVYDVLGKEVQTLVNEQLSPGIYNVDFDGNNYPSGVYYYRLEAGDFIVTKKMVLIK